MHWLLQKLKSHGNKTAIIADRENSYAEIVDLVENFEIVSPIKTDGSINDVIALLAGLKGAGINYFYEDSIDINKIYNDGKLGGEPTLILTSSGTTGKPKQVIHNYNLLVEKYRNRAQPISTVLIYPLNHIAGIDVMFSVLSSGGTLVITDDKNPTNITKLISQYELNFLACTPTFLRLMLVSGALDEYNMQSLKQISYGAERMPEQLLNVLKEKLPNVTFRQTYGTTETGVLDIYSDNTIWIKPNNNITLKGNEIGVKLPESFMGYINEEATTENGYLYLGDTFKLTRDEIQITGRKSAMINVGGEKVNPTEVEEVLYQLNGVNWCKVYAEENALMGNIVVADVLTDIDIKELREYCQTRLAPYQVPQKINKVNQIPATDRWKS